MAEIGGRGGLTPKGSGGLPSRAVGGKAGAWAGAPGPAGVTPGTASPALHPAPRPSAPWGSQPTAWAGGGVVGTTSASGLGRREAGAASPSPLGRTRRFPLGEWSPKPSHRMRGKAAPAPSALRPPPLLRDCPLQEFPPSGRRFPAACHSQEVLFLTHPPRTLGAGSAPLSPACPAMGQRRQEGQGAGAQSRAMDGKVGENRAGPPGHVTDRPPRHPPVAGP